MVLAAVRHEIAAAEQWDVEINSPSHATQPSHSLLALTGWILGAIDGHPLRRVGEAAEGGEAGTRRVDMADVLARVCRRPVRLSFVATAAAAEQLEALPQPPPPMLPEQSAAAGVTAQAVEERRAFLRDASGGGFSTESVCHGWLGKQPKRLEGTVSSEAGRSKKKWKARWVALHRTAGAGGGGGAGWSLSWASKPNAATPSGRLALCGESVLLPASGLRFGVRTPARCLRLQASDARTLAKWLAALTRALEDAS